MSARARSLQLTRLPNGRQVSTIYQPDRGWWTRVFTRIGVTLAVRRAETEAEARINHDAMVAEWTAIEERKP